LFLRPFSSTVRDEPRIHTSRAAEPKSSPEKQESPAVKHLFQNNCTEEHGDILVRGLCACGTDCIIGVPITDVDAKSQQSKDPHKALEAHEIEKKKKYLKACLKQRQYFSLFVASTDGLLGKELRTLLKKLSALLDERSVDMSMLG
jgi:hypothetical protein